MALFGRGFVSTWKAGWIVARCKTGCVANDATETIIPCSVHKEEIARLADVNERRQK